MTGFVSFGTAGDAADERLVREYVFDAVDRLPELPGCDGVAFNPLARKAGLAEMDVEGGVLVRIWGDDVGAVVDHERERWDALVEEGPASSWEWSTDDDALVEYLGERGAGRYLQIHGLASRLSEPIYEAFEDPLDPVDEFPGETRAAPTGVGWWQLLHSLSIQQNYRYAEEIDAYTEGITAAVHAIARFDDRERALREIDDVVESLESLRAAIE